MPNFNNINCQKCKKLLSIKNETESSYILTCDSCNTSVTLYKTETDKTEIPSVKDTLKHTPEIITKPYGILINLIENDEIYGALLKLKDVFELVIKLPLVIILSQTQKRITQEDEDFNTNFGTLNNILKGFINDAISYKLSVGNWVAISGAIQRAEYDNLFQNFPSNRCLKTLYDINNINYSGYSKNNISTWRNDTIGHGALNCNKEEVKADVLNMLEVLNGILIQNENFYKEITVKFDENDKNTIKISSNEDVSAISVVPFINLYSDRSGNKSSDVTLFDSFDKKKKCAYVMSYESGAKIKSGNLGAAFADIKNKIAEMEAISRISTDTYGLVYDETIYTEEIEILNELQNKTFINGSCFSQWFLNCLDTHQGGVFLCCAERGMGKSAFARAVDQLNKIKIRDNHDLLKLREENSELLIRSYYFNSYYNSDLITVFYRLKNIFTSELITTENNSVKLSSITYIAHSIEESYNKLYQAASEPDISVADKKKLFINFLQSLLEIWRYRYNKKKLILILDGIDEIKTGKNNIKISEWIPTEREFIESGLENIYIFLTSRCKDEIKTNTELCKFINNENFTDQLIITRSDQLYTKAYLGAVQELFAGTNTDFVKSLCEKLDWRYNYLSAFKKIYAIDKAAINKNLASFIDDPFEVYIINLEKLSKTYSQNIQSLLNLLVLTEEPLTINEISYLLTGDHRPAFKLYGMLTDIADFLCIEKDAQRGTLFNLSHTEWIEKINNNNHLKANKESLINELQIMLEDLISSINESTDYSLPEYDGETWLISNIGLFTIDEETILILSKLLNHKSLKKSLKNFYQIQRQIKYNKFIISNIKINHLLNMNFDEFVKPYIYCYHTLGECFTSIGEFKKSIIIYNKAISLCKNLSESNIDEDYKSSFIVFYAKFLLDSAHLYELFNCDRALQKYNKAICVFEKISQPDFPYHTIAYIDRALFISKFKYDNIDDSIKDIEKAINILRSSLQNSTNDKKQSKIYHELARAYYKKAIIIKFLDTNEAIKAINNAIIIYNDLLKISEYSIVYKISLACSYGNLGNLLKENDHDGAMKSYNRAIEINQKLKIELEQNGKYFNPTNLAITYYAIGNALVEFNPSDAITNYNKAIEIFVQLEKQYAQGGSFFDLTDLAVAYSSRAIAYKNLFEDEQGRSFLDLPLLANLYENRPLSYEKLSFIQEAIEDSKESIEILKKLKDEAIQFGNFFDFSNLAQAYINKGIILLLFNINSDNINSEAATDNFESALKIYIDLSYSKISDNPNFYTEKIAMLYLSIGCALSSDNPQEAIINFNHAIKNYQTIRSDIDSGCDIDSDSILKGLACSYFNRALVYQNISPKTALDDYYSAIKICEEINSKYYNPVQEILEFLIIIYYNLANSEMLSINNSIKYCDKAIEILNNLIGNNILIDEKLKLKIFNLKTELSYKINRKEKKSLFQALKNFINFSI